MRRLVRRLVILSLISLLFSASLSFGVVLACEPPEIVSVTRSPETPNYDQSVTIMADVISGDADIGCVILKYILNWNWTCRIEVTMNLENGVYVADIPPQPYSGSATERV